MRRYLLGCAAAGVLALSASVLAQNPPQDPAKQYPPRQNPPTTQAKPSQDAPGSVVVEGCLMKETDVPGRKPNVAERAGIGEDYVLTDAKIVKGTAPAGAKANTPTGTSGRGMMFDVKGASGDDLKKHAGHRVRIEGTLEAAEPSAAESKPENLPDLNAKAIHSASGDCAKK